MAIRSPIDLLGASAGVFEPQRTNMWKLVIYGLEKFPGISGGDPSQTLELALRKCTPPNEETEPITIPYLNQEFYVAGRFKFGQMDVEFIDYANLGVATILKVWRDSVGSPLTGDVGAPGMYKKFGKLFLLTHQVQGLGASTRSWDIHGMFPISVKWADLDMGGNDANTISVTFRVDRMIPVNLQARI